MEMLLMAACLSLFGLAVTCLAFGAATRPARVPQQPVAVAEPIVVSAPARFFGDGVAAAPFPGRQQIPIEALLLQIESHVRLEQAAAESFLYAPEAALLQSRTMSPLIQ